MFAERLDFLMKLTGARNSALGRAAHVDASTVSRLRTGQRDLPKKQDFLPSMCDFFARNIKSSYQRQSAADTICAGQAWPEDCEQGSAMIHAWLSEEVHPDIARISGLVAGLAQFSFKPPQELPQSRIEESDPLGKPYTIGHAGKREAVKRFLLTVIAAKKPRTLLLYSDESMAWLNEDPCFALEWARLMHRVLQCGNRIRIIHSTHRALDEMLEALRMWMGIYMTGAVEPYYCPRLRDGITRRTLFVAPGLAAVTASSVGDDAREGLNQFITDPAALTALTAEYARYLELSVPLMRILTHDTTNNTWALLMALMAAEGDAYLIHAAPSLCTMPRSVVQSILARTGCDLSTHWAAAAETFRKTIATSCVYEIIPVNTDAEFVTPALSPLFAAGSCACYTRQEYAAHLEAVAEMLSKNERYHVVLPKKSLSPSNMAIYHKASAGTILLREDGQPSIAFAINDAVITSAFEAYLLRLVSETDKPSYRLHVIKRLRQEAERFK